MNAQDRAQSSAQDDAHDNELQLMNPFGNSMPIPLPLEIPAPPNLSQLPAHILHSGTVETLIGQNEDLMARLKVNIRRNSILEQQIMEQDRQASELKHSQATLIAQYQILQEKDASMRDRSQSFDLKTDEMKSEVAALHEQIALMETRVSAAEERRDELHAGLKFERSYRRRIRAWVRPLISKLHDGLNEAKTRNSFLDRQLSTREAVIGDLRERLAQTVSQMQGLQVATNQNQALIVESYETRLAKVDAESANARTELTLLREKAKRLEDAVASEAVANNKIIALERKTSDIEHQIQAYKAEAKKLAAEAMSAHQDRDRMAKESADAVAELSRAQDQFESLQAVWAETQKKLEATQLQQEALNKLNQELSRQLKSERKNREAAPVAMSTESHLGMSETTSERIGKIDSILAELESGFAKSKIDFIETQAGL